MAMVTKKTTIEVALDSGSLANILYPDELPDSTELAPITSRALMDPISKIVWRIAHG